MRKKVGNMQNKKKRENTFHCIIYTLLYKTYKDTVREKQCGTH